MSPAAVKLLAFAVWTALVFWAGSVFTGRGADRDAARAQVAQSGAAVTQVQEARTTEHQQAESMAAIGAKHEEDRTAAQAVPAAVVAGVRDGSLQLRDDLATCETSRLSQAVAGAVERDARAQLRGEVAGDLVQVGRDADNHVRACQAIEQAHQLSPSGDVSLRQ